MRITAGTLILIAVIAVIWSSSNVKPPRLPFLGDPVYKKKNTAQGPKTDTIYPIIPPFSFTDQQRQPVSNSTYKGHIYIADFFFTSCPTICPVMSRNLKKVYDHYADVPGLMFLSHTIDPKFDTPDVLNRYAEKLGADSKRWHFVTGPKEVIYQLAENGYYSHAEKDDAEKGGFIHSGAFILIDKLGRMRGMYDGTNDSEVGQLIRDIKVLLTE